MYWASHGRTGPIKSDYHEISHFVHIIHLLSEPRQCPFGIADPQMPIFGLPRLYVESFDVLYSINNELYMVA